MNNGEGVQKRILLKAEEMFFRYGISKVSMEEIAKELGISKKTLYKHFSNKEHIIKTLIQQSHSQMEAFMNGLLKDEQMEFIDKMKSFMNFLAERSKKVNHPIIPEIVRHYPELWREIKEFTEGKAQENFKNFISQGVNSGLFRDDIHVEVIVIIFFAAVRATFDTDIYDRLPISALEMKNSVHKIFFEGIISPAGRKQFGKSIFKNEKDGESRS